MTTPARDFFTSIEAAQEARAVAQARTRRRRLLRWSAPVVGVVGLAALFLLAICGVVVIGERSYASQSYASAGGQFSVVRAVNAVETWKPHYNVGTAEYSSGRFFRATQDFGVALTLVPRAPEGEPPGRDECLVRINFSLALEGLGDEAARANDHPMAIDYYGQALEMVTGCGNSGGGGGSDEEQQSADEAQERQERKQGEQENEQSSGEGENEGQSGEGENEGQSGENGENEGQSGENGENEGESGENGENEGEGDSGGEGTEESTMSQQQRDLEERNREAQEEREREQQESGGGGGGRQGW